MKALRFIGDIKIVPLSGEKPWVKGLASMRRNKSVLMQQLAEAVIQRIQETMYSRGFVRRTGISEKEIGYDNVTANGFDIVSGHPKHYQFEHGTTEAGATVISAKPGGNMFVPVSPDIRYSDSWEQAIRSRDYSDFWRGIDYRVLKEVRVVQHPFISPVLEEMYERGFVAQFGSKLFGAMIDE